MAVMGKAGYDVLREAEDSEVIGRLASMAQGEFTEDLLAGSLGEPGESLDPLARTIFTLSLEHIPAGFGKVSTVVEYVKEAMQEYVRRQFTAGKSAGEVTTTLRRRLNYNSHETITFLEAVRIGHCGIEVSGMPRANPRAAISELRTAQLFGNPPMSSTDYIMPTTAFAVQLDASKTCSYRPLFGGDVGSAAADMEVLELAKKWYDAIHGTTAGLANFYEAVKRPLRAVPFDDLKYAMFKCEHAFMVGRAKARLGRVVSPGDCYSVYLKADGETAGPQRRVLSTILQTLKDEAHELLVNKQSVGEIAAEMKGQIAAEVLPIAAEMKGQIAAQVLEQLRKDGTALSTPTPTGAGTKADQAAITALKKESRSLQRAMNKLQHQVKGDKVRRNLARGDDEDGDNTAQGAGGGTTVTFQRESVKRGASQQLDSGHNKKARPGEMERMAALEERVNDDDQIDKVCIADCFQAGLRARVLYEALAGFQEGKHADADCLTGLLFYPSKGICKNQKCKQRHNTDELLDKSDRREVLLSAIKTAARGQVL
jgi:hypothetical protein